MVNKIKFGLTQEPTFERRSIYVHSNCIKFRTHFVGLQKLDTTEVKRNGWKIYKHAEAKSRTIVCFQQISWY